MRRAQWHRRILGVVAMLACTCGIGSSAAAQKNASESSQTPSARAILPPAEIDEDLVIGGEELEAKKLASRMTVEVHVNETGPYKFIVDSGADTSVVGEQMAARLSMPAAKPSLLLGVTEIKQVDMVTVDQLRVGSTTFRGLKVPALRERDIGAAGMIGLDALVDQRLMMDFEKRVITVDDSSVPEPEYKGVIVVTARLNRGQLILTEVEAGGQTIDAVIDTGTEITIGNSALKELLFRRSSRDPTMIGVIGVTGKEIELEIAVVKELKLGPITIYNVAIGFADIPPFEVFELAERPALLLGTDLMEHFRKVSLDFGARKVRFQLKKCERRGFTLRTAVEATRIRNSRARMEAEKVSACAR